MAIWDHLPKLLRPEPKPEGERPAAQPAPESPAPEPAPVIDELELLPEAELAPPPPPPEPPPPPPGPQPGDFLPVNRAELLSKGEDAWQRHHVGCSVSAYWS